MKREEILKKCREESEKVKAKHGIDHDADRIGELYEVAWRWAHTIDYERLKADDTDLPVDFGEPETFAKAHIDFTAWCNANDFTRKEMISALLHFGLWVRILQEEKKDE